MLTSSRANRFSLLLTLTLVRLTLLAQNGPPTAEQVRANMRQGLSTESLPPVFKTEVRKIGVDSIPIQIYYPSSETGLPLIYNIHGGAFVMSALDGLAARVLCNRTQSIVVSIDYRVAPEHPFPASINDCYAVWNWIVHNAGALGGDPKKITLLGDSAGGLFTGALQVKRQQTGQPERPRALVFVNPGIDMRPTAAGAEAYALVSDWYLSARSRP